MRSLPIDIGELSEQVYSIRITDEMVLDAMKHVPYISDQELYSKALERYIIDKYVPKEN